MLETGALGLQTHVDVFGHQHHLAFGLTLLQVERRIDDAVVILLVGEYRFAFRQVVVGKNRQPSGTVLATPLSQPDPFGNLFGSGLAKHILQGTDRHPRFAADILLAILDVVELFQHRHRDDDVVFLKGVNGEGFVEQNIGVEDKQLAIVALHRQPPWLVADPVNDVPMTVTPQPDDRTMTRFHRTPVVDRAATAVCRRLRASQQKNLSRQ